MRPIASKRKKDSCLGSIFPLLLAIVVITVGTVLFYIAIMLQEGPEEAISRLPAVTFPSTRPQPIIKIGSPQVVIDNANVQIDPHTSKIVIPPFTNGTVVDGAEFHFVHIPKCGGTSMTAVLREIACYLNPYGHKDCCTNPGFCDFHAFRRCQVIKGCINHFPQRYTEPVYGLTQRINHCL